MNAEDTRTVVRVGWHEPPYFITDETGRKSGYSYEYQRKVAAYTGWEYEYVEGSWADLMQMMKEGKIDLLSDVSYSEERTRDMLFTSITMGTEVYYVFVSPDNTEICSENLSSLNGKTIGSSYFYFAVNKKRPDLLLELDAALNKIQDENKYYDQQLHDKYLKATETIRYLSQSESEWLAGHETIRVGYQDNYLAFCAKDPSTGALTGALKDYLDYAATAFDNTVLHFEAVPFATAKEAMDALQSGEIDCMFPANLTDYDAEEPGLLISPPLMHTKMEAVVREAEQRNLSRKRM